MSNFGAGINVGMVSSDLAKEIAYHKNHKKVKIIDRIHAAMIVLSLFSPLVIVGMLPYFSPACDKLFTIFIDWQDNSTFFTWVKIFIFAAIVLLLSIFVIYPLMNKLARMSIWYALGIFTITMGTSVTMLVLAIAK